MARALELEYDAAQHSKLIVKLVEARAICFEILGALDDGDAHRIAVQGTVDAIDDSLADLRGDLWGIQQQIEEREFVA